MLIYAPFLKFLSTAVLAALIDVVVLLIVMSLTQNLLFSIVGARMISALFQYFANAEMVFKKTTNTLQSMMRYGGLVIALLCCNYFMMNSLINIGMTVLLAKIITETILFIASYHMQKNFVYVL